MTPENKEKLYQLVSKTFEIPLDQINDSMAVGSIPQWDSLAHLSLISGIEEAFGIAFDVDELFEVETLADFVALLEKEGF